MLEIEIWLWFDFFRIIFIFNERRGSKIAIWTFLKSLGTQQCLVRASSLSRRARNAGKQPKISRWYSHILGYAESWRVGLEWVKGLKGSFVWQISWIFENGVKRDLWRQKLLDWQFLFFILDLNTWKKNIFNIYL